MSEKPSSTTLKAPQTRLDRACKYLENKWFPVSSNVLDQIEKLLSDKSTEDSHQELISIIQKDHSLTLFIYKELCLNKIEAENQDIQYQSPLEELKKATPSDIHNILKESFATLRMHSLDSSKSYQVARLKEALVALVTTKTLCEQSDIDPDLGAEVSLLRQIGYLLIAWNYPSIYQAAASKVSETENLEDLLVKALGFSPATLALSLSQKWGLGSIFRDSLLDFEQESILGPSETSSVAKSISKLCEIGEKLARANNPELYPSALHDWEDAKEAIEIALGKEGLAIIDQSLVSECEALYIDSPHIFKPGTLLSLEERLIEREGAKSISSNPYLESCDEEVKEELKILYDLIAAGERAEKTVSLLLRKILPLAGFNSSALFTLEPGTKRLALQLKAGEIKLRQGQNLAELKYKDMFDIVPLAFHSADVLSQNVDIKPNGDKTLPVALATFFGCSQRFGVFYVELPRQIYHQNISASHNKLKALAFTLNDCLELV